MDDEKVGKAVGFILHPSVRGSAEDAKRSFLSKKGLTKEEIDEAFRRAATSAGASGGVTSSASIDASASIDSSTGAQVHGTPAVTPGTATVPGYSYSNILLGVGFAAAAGYSIKTIFGPSINKTIQSIKNSFYSNVSSKEDGPNVDSDSRALDLGDLDRQNGPSTADPQELSIVEIDDLEDAACVDRIRAESDSSRQLIEALQDLREEVRSLGQRLNRIAPDGAGGPHTFEPMTQPANGISSARESSRDEESAPMSYMQVLEMLEQGRPIPGIRDDINDKPPNPTVSPTASILQSRSKPWENTGNHGDNAENLKIEIENMEDGGSSSGTPARAPTRRDISGNRPSSSIYESVTKTPDTNSRSPWKPPPIPSPSLT